MGTVDLEIFVDPFFGVSRGFLAFPGLFLNNFRILWPFQGVFGISRFFFLAFPGFFFAFPGFFFGISRVFCFGISRGFFWHFQGRSFLYFQVAFGISRFFFAFPGLYFSNFQVFLWHVWVFLWYFQGFCLHFQGVFGISRVFVCISREFLAFPGVAFCVFPGGFWRFHVFFCISGVFLALPGLFSGISRSFLASPFSCRRLSHDAVASLLRFPPKTFLLGGASVQNRARFAPPTSSPMRCRFVKRRL